MTRRGWNRGLCARHPKRYAGTIEQAEQLHVADLLARLPAEERRAREVYVPAPNVILRRETKGVIRPWWVLLCARCGRRCEYVVKPPWATDPNDWRCRRCWNLTYASHRHGKSEESPARLLARRNPTRTQRLRIEKVIRQDGCVAARHGQRRRDAERTAAYVRPVVARMTRAVRDGRPCAIVSDRLHGARIVPHDRLVEEVCAEMIAENERQRLRDELRAPGGGGSQQALVRFQPDGALDASGCAVGQ